jgi:hypothetical protein
MTRRAAFFDVDGTLLTVTSLFRFLAYDCVVRRQPESYVDTMADLTALKAAGASRVEANRAFFAAFAGRSVADLVTGGRRWFALERVLGDLFDPRVLPLLRRHSVGGDLVVLLSGSFARASTRSPGSPARTSSCAPNRRWRATATPGGSPTRWSARARRWPPRRSPPSTGSTWPTASPTATTLPTARYSN